MKYYNYIITDAELPAGKDLVAQGNWTEEEYEKLIEPLLK
jgi:hypothetical protein